MTVAPGDLLPPIALTDTAGRTVRLDELRGEDVVLVFLRHLACLPCREHLMEVLSHRERWGVRVVVVAFASPSALVAYQRKSGLEDLLVLSDELRLTYAEFGLGRGSFARVWLHPAVWWRYARLIAAGRRPTPAQEDPLQLGGDALVDAAGRVRWIYRSRGPEDRPSAPQLQRALSAMRRA